MTLLEELFEKRANELAGMFAPRAESTQGQPIVRDSIVRGNAGEGHFIREGETLKNVRRIDRRKKAPSEASVRRLLGVFGSEN